jgi:hypothetical protein
VVIFPIVSSVLAALCAIVIGRDALRRPRADKRAWFIAFVLFALAAGADAWGRQLGWSEPLARLYYATGPALVVAFLAIGELYLLFPRQMGRFAPGAAILLTASWMTLVLDAPIDAARLQADGWEAIDRSGALRVMAITINSVGTTIIVGGLLWSVWRFWRTRTQRNRLIRCVLIVTGTLAVAMGGTLTRFGQYEYLYIAMSVGIALIFGGVVRTRRPDTAIVPNEDASVTGFSTVPASERVAVHSVAAYSEETTPELAFLTEKTMQRAGDDFRGWLASWSVALDDDPTMSRRDARQAWRLRRELPPAGRARFDEMTVPERRALVQLAADVLQLPALTRIDDSSREREESVRSSVNA